MLYIEGPRMDWTINDRLYHRFIKWRLKCKNIPECKLAALPEKQQCKKGIAWSGHFGMDQYVSWSLPKDEFSLNTIWDRFEEFCNPKSNEIRACFDLLTSFQQGNCSVDKWYNVVQAPVNLAKYLLETAKILHCDIFWFVMKDEDFVSEAINEGSGDPEKFPESRVCQLAKKMESSNPTARYIRQVAGDPWGAQINLLCHQSIELPPGKHKKKKPGVKQRQLHSKNTEKQPLSQFKRNFDPKLAHRNTNRYPKYGDSTHWKGFHCPAKWFQSMSCHMYGHYTSLCHQRSQNMLISFKARKPKAHQLQAGALYAQDSAICNQSEASSSEDSFCLQLKVQCTQAGIKNIPPPVNVDFSSCFSICNLVFSHIQD